MINVSQPKFGTKTRKEIDYGLYRFAVRINESYATNKRGKALWKRNITGYGIWCINMAKKKLKNRHELTEEDFDYIKHLDNRWRVDEYLTKYDEPIEVVSHN